MDGGRHDRSTVRHARRADRSALRMRLGVLLVGIALVGSIAGLFAVRGVRILTLQRHLRASSVARDEALDTQQDLKDRLAQKDDLTAIEDAAREKLGWVKPGEIRVIFVAPTSGEAGG